MKTPSLSATLLTNTTLSAIGGLLLLAVPGLISDIMGNVPAWLCQTVGAGLVAFAAFVFWVERSVARANTASAPWVAWVLAMDLSWIIATPVVMVLFANHLSLWGHVLLIDVALLVSAFAYLERHWLKQMRKGASAVA